VGACESQATNQPAASLLPAAPAERGSIVNRMTFEAKVILLRHTYDAFNRRDVDAVLSALDPEIEWPNVLERSVIHGRQAVLQYWKATVSADPLAGDTDRLQPVRRAGDRDVHQVVRDRQTNQVREQLVAHAYTFTFRGDLVLRMEVYATADDARR
jgi:ketosteroid isomerase-like protein